MGYRTEKKYRKGYHLHKIKAVQLLGLLKNESDPSWHEYDGRDGVYGPPLPKSVILVAIRNSVWFDVPGL